MPELIFSASPHIHRGRTVTTTMLHVLVALIPALVCGVYYFGLAALWVLMVSVGTCVAAEWAITRWMLCRPSTIGDLTAVVTGVLLAMNLPSSIPLWTVAFGAVFSIGIVKLAFGGLGCNIFNPAIAGRVFLLISFPALMTEWPVPLAADGSTGATLLSRLSEGDVPQISAIDMLLGNMGGSLGEVGSLAILAGFVYLLAVRVISWHIPVSILAGVGMMCIVADAPVAMNVLSGGLLLGAVFMATDYVTSPMTRSGMIVYGLMIGIITMIIRLWGSYPEGVSFAILLMNGATPLINRYIRPRRFGERRAAA